MARVLQHHDLLIDTKLNNFLSKLDQLPAYKRRKLLNSKCGEKPYPRFLYKFRPLIAKSTEQTDRLRDYLVESRLWLSSPTAFNDPFDMRGQFVFVGKPQDKRKHINNRLKQLRPDLVKSQRETFAFNILSNNLIIENLEDRYGQLRENFGVCSFTEDTRNILMWAHYGSNHTGVSLQFQLAQDLSVFSHALKVDNLPEYPIIDYLKETLGKALGRTLLRKSELWAYEKERRILQPDGANHYLKFNPSALTALILGCEISIDEEKVIKMLIIERKQKGYPALKIFRAIRHRTKYGLCLQHQKNWGGSESAR